MSQIHERSQNCAVPIEIPLLSVGETRSSVASISPAVAADNINILPQGVHRQRQNNNEPKKRAVLLTAFLACLSFLVLIINSIISFVTELMDNNKLWEYVFTCLQNNVTNSYCNKTV